MAERIDRPEIYEAARRFVDAGLRRDDSLFTPGEPIWSAAGAADLYVRFVDHPDESADSFLNKFQRQLDGAPAATVQLAAEVLFVHLLMPWDMRGNTKRGMIEAVLSWSPSPARIPDYLRDALDVGVARLGAGHTLRNYQLQFLLELLRHWKSLPSDEQIRLLGDPWEFKGEVARTPGRQDQAQREALLHLMYPDTFEPIVSRSHKYRIADYFADRADRSGEDVDLRLMRIRDSLAGDHAPNFSFYDPGIRERWDGSAPTPLVVPPVLPPTPPVPRVATLASLADELYVAPAFLEEIDGLLRDKGADAVLGRLEPG